MDLNKLKREDVKVVSDDLSEILAQTIADYEARSGKTLQPAHIERLLINTYAYRETLARKAVNEAYRQQHPRFATGLMLDLCGDDVNTPRLSATAARCTIRFGEVEITEGYGNKRHNGEIVRNGRHAYGHSDRWAHYRITMPHAITNDQADLLRHTLNAFAPARCVLAALDYQHAALRHNGRALRDGKFNRGTA